MWYSAQLNAFFDAEIHGEAAIPVGAVEIEASLYARLMESQSNGMRIAADAHGRPISIEPPAETPKQALERLRRCIQKHLDEHAAAMGYDDIRTAVTYADESCVPKFQAEGQALRAWRSLVWEKAYALLDSWNSSENPVPDAATVIASLPAFDLSTSDPSGD